ADSSATYVSRSTSSIQQDFGWRQLGTGHLRLTYRHSSKRRKRGPMSLLKRLLGKNDPPKPRVRICVECGMPIAEHKEWCSILRGQLEMQRRTKGAVAQSS